MTIRTTDKTVSLALAIARDPATVANAPKGSAKGQPGTFSDALACLPASVKAIGYTPAADVAPLPYDDEGAGHKAIMFSLDAIKTHLPEWEAKFRRMRGDQWRTVTINEQTFIINVHSRRPIEFRAVDPDKWGYSCAYHASDSREPAAAPQSEPMQVKMFGPDDDEKVDPNGVMGVFNKKFVYALIDKVGQQADENAALKATMANMVPASEVLRVTSALVGAVAEAIGKIASADATTAPLAPTTPHAAALPAKVRDLATHRARKGTDTDTAG